MAYFDMGPFRKLRRQTLPDQHAQGAQGEDSHDHPEDTDIVGEQGLLCCKECKDEEDVREDYLGECSSKSVDDKLVRRAGPDDGTTHDTERTLAGCRLIFLRVRASGADIPASDSEQGQHQLTVAAGISHPKQGKHFPSAIAQIKFADLRMSFCSAPSSQVSRQSSLFFIG
jgi:hypothetical protein